MSVEADVRNAILSHAPDRVFPDFAPEFALNSPDPFVTFTQIGGEAQAILSGPDKLRRIRMQINVWARTRLAANTIARAVEESMRTATEFTGFRLAEFTAVYDQPTGWYGTTQDFRVIWRPE